MAKERVYKIVVDDTEVNRVLDRTEARIRQFGQVADRSFQGVGRGMATGLGQANRQIERTGQVSRQAAQQIVTAERQTNQARRESLRTLDEQIRKLRERKRALEESAALSRESATSFTKQLEEARRAQEQQALRVQQLQKAGATPQEIARAQEPITRGRGDIERLALIRAERTFRGTSEQEEAGEIGAEIEQAQQRRLQLQQEIAQGAQAQAQAEAQAQQQVQAAQEQTAQSAAQAAQVQLRGAGETVQALQKQAQEQETLLAARRQDVQAARADLRAQREVINDQTRAIQRQGQVVRDAAEETRAARARGDKDETAAAKSFEESARKRLEILKREKVEQQAAADEKQKNLNRAVAAEQQQAQVTEQASTRAVAAKKQEEAAEKQLAAAVRAEAAEKARLAKREREAERQFVRTVKAFNTQRNELHKLNKEHGSFNVTIGKSSGELNELEQEVWDVINADVRLREEVDKIIAKQGEFNVAINRSTFRGGTQEGFARGQFRQLGFAGQRLGIPGAAAFGEAAAVGGAAGVAAAGVLLTVNALIQAFKSMAGAAADAFKVVIENSVEAAKELEVAEAQFTAIFKGDSQAAEAALGRLLSLSQELGENVVGIGRAFLPEVESIDQLEEVVKIATALARFQPEQGILGARIALQEALAGEFRSLQRRFEISPIAIDRIRQAFETSGVQGFLQELQLELERTGRSVDDLAGTFSVSLGRVQERLRQVSAELGEPILEGLKDQLADIDDELERIDPDLKVIAQGFGEVVAEVVDLIGTEVTSFLESFDPDPLLEVVEALFAVVDAFSILFATADAGAGSANVLEGALHSLAGGLLTLEGFFLDISLTIAQFRSDLIGLLPVIDFMGEAMDKAGKASGGATGALFDLSEAQLKVLEAFLESGPVLDDIIRRQAEHEEKVLNFSRGLDEFGASLRDSGEEGEEAADRYLKIGQNMDKLIVIQEDYIKTQEKVNDVVREFNIDATMRLEKILTQASRTRLKAEIDNAQKLIDIAEKNRRKIEDIRAKFDQDVIGASVDLSDREQDITRKHGDALIDLEAEIADERLDAEQKFRDNLERIRDKFNFDAFEAILANDAKRLRQIRRRQAFEEQQARKDRDRDVRDIDESADDRRKKLEIALQRELRDARIANARKIRDLETTLKEQLDRQETARKRDVEDQAKAERRKRAELQVSLDQQLEDYNTWWEDRHRITTEKIAEDLEAMQGYINSAMEIMAQLSTLGVAFNPLTGMPELVVSMPEIDPQTAAIEEIIQRVVELSLARDVIQGRPGRTGEEVRAEIEALGVEDLVEELDKLQRALGTAELEPDKFIETFGLARQLLLDQALQVGRQAGLSAEKIVSQTVELSLGGLADWVQDFVDRYRMPVLPDFSLFGDVASILATPGGFTPVPTDGAPFPFTPGPQTPLPGAGQGFITDGAGIFNIPQAIPGQTPFIFPNVTDAPFVTPAPGQPGFLPGFGQAITGPVGEIPNLFLPGNILGTNPAFGLTAEDFQAQLDEQVEAQVVAELLKRGEIEDTVELARLLAEQQVFAVSSLLDDEVAEFQATSDAEIAILEQTIAKQREALAALQEGPGLEEDAETVETALDILEETLARKREALQQQTQALVAEEAAAQVEAEEEKQDAIDETLGAFERAVAQKVRATEQGLDDETRAQQEASEEQLVAERDKLLAQQELEAENREIQMEADVEHIEMRAELFGEANQNALENLHDFWMAWIRLNADGIQRDLQQLQQWLENRLLLIDSAFLNIPGGGGNLPLDPLGGDGNIAELESLAQFYGQQLGLSPAEINDIIADLSEQQLQNLVQEWMDQLGFAALGGGAVPGQSMIVGEQGIELVRFNQVAKIDPISALFRNTPPVGVGGAPTTVDRSTNFGGFNFPDPRGVPPIYIEMMTNIASKVVKKSLVGR